jgi:hypothetical protein
MKKKHLHFKLINNVLSLRNNTKHMYMIKLYNKYLINNLIYIPKEEKLFNTGAGRNSELIAL